MLPEDQTLRTTHYSMTSVMQVKVQGVMGACKEASYPGSVKESVSGHKPGKMSSRQREKPCKRVTAVLKGS